MPRIKKNHYSAFQRRILAEFMSEYELKQLDLNYNRAKFSREIRRLTKEREQLK